MRSPRGHLAVLLVAASLGGAPGEARGQADEALKISHLEFNCDLQRCARPEEYRRFLSLTDLWVGRTYSKQAVDEAVRNLQKTGFFDRVEPFVQADRLGVSVTLDTVGAIVVRRIEIDADWTILESDIRRRLAYRLGERLKMGEVDVERQKQSVLKFLAKRGYHRSTVDIDFDIDGHEATVHVTIDVGHFFTIDAVKPVGNAHVSDFWFSVYYLQPRQFGLSGLYLPETIKAAERDVLERYHDAGFFEARLNVEEVIDQADRTVDLTVKVDEGRRTKVFFEGNDAVADHELEELVTFREARSVDSVEIERTASTLRAAYQSRGYHHATVKAFVVKTKNPTMQELVFDIHEGPVARIEHIRFLGNKGFSDEKLRDVVATKTFNAVLGRPGFALDAQLAEDLDKLRNHYIESGYLRAKAEVAEVASRQDGEYLTVVYRLSEGPRTLVSEVQIEGVTRYPREKVFKVMGLRPGTPYGPRRVAEAVGELQRRYRTDGYPHAVLEHECALPNGKVQPCDVARVAAGRTVEVRVDVEEGPRVTVGEILVRGNFVTDEDTIRNEMPLKEGGPFEYAKLLEGQSNIRSLRLFRSVRADLIGFAEGEDRDRVGIVVVVEEREYLFVDFAVGFQTVSRSADAAELELGLYAEAAFLDQNVLGWGKQVALPLRVGNLETSLTPTYTDPRVFGTRTRMDLSFSFSARNDTGDDTLPIPLELSTFAEVERPQEAFNTFEAATAVKFLRDFSRVTKGGLEIGLDRVIRRVQATVPDPDDPKKRIPAEIQPDATGQLCLFGGRPTECLGDRETTLRLTPSVVQDLRDSPLHPTQGYRLSGKVTFGTILKKIDPLADGFAEDQFVRTYGGAQTYRSFLARRLVLANSIRVGLGFPLGSEARLPTADLFKLGGASTVRGLTDEGVSTPRNAGTGLEDGNHTAVFNVELRGRLFWWFWAVLFYDAGVLVDTLDELGDELAFRHSAGFGLRWLLLDQIPVRADFAFPLAIAPGEETIPFHIAIGYPF